MIGPSSQISKMLVGLLFLMILFYVWMDVNLYIRVQSYPRDRNFAQNLTPNYKDAAWFSCDVTPLCDVTVKALLLDHTNHYLLAPLVMIVDNVVGISQTAWITPNSISFFHVFVAVVSGKFVSSDSLVYRRVGVVLFEFRTFLDDMDGHVARARKHIRGERSEIGTSGYYIDGLCDAIGCVALMVGTFIFLKNNPPRRGYTQLPLSAPCDIKEKDSGIVFKAKVTTKKVMRKVTVFSLLLLFSSTAWNRYIALYQDLLERNSVTKAEFVRQNAVFQSTLFFCVAWLWRLANVHNLMDLLLLSIFCDKLWEFLKRIHYIGFVLFCVVCVTEMHLLDVQNYIFGNLYGNSTEY